ncbi:hypothetical protein EV175_005702, partial [Coemansia sp. RSA 1933]
QGATPQTQRLMRELSAEFGSSGGSDVRNRAVRQAADYPLWSTPLSRRSVSLLHNHAKAPDHLESIGEDSDGAAYRPIRGMSALQEVPYNPSDRAGLRVPQTVSGMQSIMRPALYMQPSPHYPFIYGPSTAGTSSWSRQDSFSYFTGGPSTVSGYPSQVSVAGGRQFSRGSVDTVLAMRAADGNVSSYIGSRSSTYSGGFPGADSRALDVVHIDALFKLAYRLNILAVETDTNTVLPSFEYFVARQADELASYRIHRASTVSVGSIPYSQLQAGKQAISTGRSAQVVNDEDALDVDTLNRDGTDKRPSITTYPISSEAPATIAGGAAGSLLLPSDNDSDRAKSTSPAPLAQPLPLPLRTVPMSHRYTRSVSPAAAPTTPLSNVVPDPRVGHEIYSSGSHVLPLQPALNEPPTPLYLSEAMSQQHLVAILAMVVRQFECAVDSLDDVRHTTGTDNGGRIAASRSDMRNDSKMDEELSSAGATLRYALEQVSNSSRGLDDAGFEWTQDHIVNALESYAKQSRM